MLNLEDDKHTSAKRQILFPILSLAFLIGLIYSNSLYAPFHFDDYRNIEINTNIFMRDLSWSSIQNTFYGMNNIGTRILRPFAYLSFGLNYYLGGLNPFGYHVVNVTIHFLTAFFLYLFVRETMQLPALKKRYGCSAYSVALLTAVLWASHPIHTQAVTYVVQRMASMSAMFYITSLFFFIKGRLSSAKGKWVYFAGSALSAVLAFGTKENAAVLPLTILLYDFLFLQDKLSAQKKRKIFLAALVTVTIPLLLAVLFQGPNVFHDIAVEIQKGYPERDFTPYQRVLTEFRVVIYYVTLLLYPSQDRLSLNHDYAISHSFLDPPMTLLAAGSIFVLIAGSIVFARKSPLISFCIIWYFLNMLIESSIFNLELVFEHRLYLPSMSLFLLFSIGITSLLDKAKLTGKKTVLASLLCLFILLQGNGTYVRNFVWQSEYALWNDCCIKAPANARALENLGCTCYFMGLYDRAEELLLASLRIKDSDNALNTLGSVYAEKHQHKKALDIYQRVERKLPKSPTVIANQGIVYYYMGQLDKAEAAFIKSLKVFPTADAQHNLGLVYLARNQFTDALSCFKKVIESQPSYVKADYHMGIVYTHLRMYQAALLSFNKVLNVRPQDPQALLGKAQVYAAVGNRNAAASVLTELLNGHAFNYKGNLLMGQDALYRKEYFRAKACLRTAASVNPEASEPFQYLAILYGQTGNETLKKYYEDQIKRKQAEKCPSAG